WEVIKNMFEGNKELKKTQKTILKQNYENFAASSQEGQDKTYDRFQKLISQLEIHGEVISQEDANLKLLRCLPSAWNNIALIMRNKSDLYTLSMDDLYNNIKVYESEIKSQSSSSSNSQNVAFVSLDNSSSTNKTVNTAHSVSAASSKDQIDTNNLEEMDLKWQVALLTIRVKRFIQKTGRKLDLNVKKTVGFDRTKVKCFNYHRRGHFARECRAPRNQRNRNRDAPTRNAPVVTSTTNALVVQDGIGGYDWSFQPEEELTNFALMAYTSQGSSSSSNLDSELENALKEKDDLKLKLEKFETSSKNLTKLINSQISATNKTGLGYDGQINESDLNDIHVNESEVLNNVVDSHESDGDDNQVNDRFKKSEGYYVVSLPYTGNYMPLRADLSFVGLDNSVFKSNVSETITNVPKIKTNASKTSKDSLEKPKTVRSNAPLIKDWESNSEDENVFKPKEVEKIVKPSLEKIEFVRVRNTTVENENKAKKPRKFSQSPRDQEIFDSGCSRHMTGNKSYLTDYQDIDGGFVSFRGNAKGGKISGKGIENQMDHKVKTIRCDNGTEFKNRIMNEFCEIKGIRREFNVVRTPQQNGVAKRKNMTLIEAARTMLADSKLPTTFWTEAVNTAFYV
nr:ribonuclease H-like domain-containing protein [Tanacetum cinerariifolium]